MVDRMYGWPAGYGFRRAAPSAPGVGRTRHPVSGAVWRPRLPYGNFLRNVEASKFLLAVVRISNPWFLYGNLLILLGVTPRPIARL